jgi:starvation-inducible DNA-binding protein
MPVINKQQSTIFMAQNQIGLEANESKGLADKLNSLLANYQVFYMNARGFHWNITGEKFFELHAKFEELYNDLVLKVDEVAERILTLGHTPLHTFSDYSSITTIKEAKNVSNGKEAMQSILESFRTLIALQREIAETADKAGDEGTTALMSDYIREQEKTVWMYSAYLT